MAKFKVEKKRKKKTKQQKTTNSNTFKTIEPKGKPLVARHCSAGLARLKKKTKKTQPGKGSFECLPGIPITV